MRNSLFPPSVRLLAALPSIFLPLAGEGAGGEAELVVDLESPGKAISSDLVGIFFEDLNYAADGGLYAELIQNRSFEYSATEQPEWGPFSFWDLVESGGGKGHLGLGNARPVHLNNPHYLLLTVTEAGSGVGVANGGFDQIPVEAGKSYEASFWTYQAYMGRRWSGDPAEEDEPMPVTLRLEAEDGSVLAEATLAVKGREWTRHAATLVPSESSERARFVLLAHKPGCLAVDMVSLFPKDTFQGRPNGLRRDLAEAIADLQPRFLRFPGGCLVHGPGVRHYYDWKATVGPVEQRRAQRNIWGYHQTFGLGYFEYFQFSEDIGAIPLPVVSAGVCCQHAGDSPHRGQEGLPMEEMPAYIQDILDLIEWANGPLDSRWGAVRAAAGHPEPFGLKYLGVGNEDAITEIFRERFRMIHEVLAEKHPEIVVVGTVGPFASGEDYDKGWEFARELDLELVDEHFYMEPQWFWDNRDRYDRYDRDSAKVYVGEYAAHEPDRRNTLRSALAEAVGLLGFERNGDLVQFASYAPLLARRGHTQWTPDLIYFTGTEVYPTINYQVQQLFSLHAGDSALPFELSGVSDGRKLAASVVRDSTTGDLIIKLVNGESSPAPCRFNLISSGNTGYVLSASVLAHENADITHEDGQPMAVPVKEESTRVDGRFERVLPPHSLTILRLQ